MFLVCLVLNEVFFSLYVITLQTQPTDYILFRIMSNDSQNVFVYYFCMNNEYENVSKLF